MGPVACAEVLSNRISDTLVMGSAVTHSSSHEHLLVIVPFSKPKDITQQILNENPGLSLTWLGDDSIHPLKAWANDIDVPTGESHPLSISPVTFSPYDASF